MEKNFTDVWCFHPNACDNDIQDDKSFFEKKKNRISGEWEIVSFSSVHYYLCICQGVAFNAPPNIDFLSVFFVERASPWNIDNGIINCTINL